MMAARVRLTADVDPEVKKRVRIAAIESDTSVSEWVERAVLRELEGAVNEERHEAGVRQSVELDPRNTGAPSRIDERRTLLEAIVADRDGLYLPPPGSKPRGSENPPKLKDGSKISDAVIEDRR
jgi:hypothetical protein